jgi:uracil-DNA glycosylase
MAHINLEDKNTLCQGCNILNQPKPEHTILDYEGKDPVDILFVSDSFRYGFDGRLSIFSDKEIDLIIDNLPKGLSWGVSPAVKCPSVKEKDLKTSDIHICRQHLYNTISQYKPKLVFACGNLALKMLTKKSGILGKRGRAYSETIQGHTFTVVPIYHPYSVVLEPKNKYLFDLDIKNGIDKIIFNKKDAGTFSYKLISSKDELMAVEEQIKLSPVKSLDIESTGLDFRNDTIHTVAITYGIDDPTIVIPIDHKDSPLSPEDREYCLGFLRSICADNTVKVLQNCKFDYKFLKRYGIMINNMWDTKIMAHLIDENTPKSLKDLVKEHFPLELEIL